MEKDFETKLRLQQRSNGSAGGSAKGAASQRIASSMSFRAPQEQFTIQDFQLGKIYGTGSYSKVVRAKKIDSGNIYALKIMDKKFITKENKIPYVKLERIVLDQLEHPGIIRLFFTFQDTYSLYMALQSCEGGELFDQITRKGRLPENEARFYAAEIVDALEYIHGVGLIHRDIKPENLLLTSDGHIKIADFGTVKPTRDSKITVVPDTNEKACTFVGTAAYIPPEVLNSSPPTLGNDLWALGCTIYQMLTGIAPFKDASEWLIFQRIMARDLKFPDYLSPESKDLVDKLLDPDPTKRLGVGPGGYKVLKAHPFFRGISWNNLRESSAPKLALDLNAEKEDEFQESSWNLAHIGDLSPYPRGSQEGSSGAGSSESHNHISALASIDSFDSKWQEFLEPGESIMMISKVKKVQKLSKKKVQLILTNRPKLICIDPSKLMVKPDVIWSDNPNDLTVHVSNSSHFKISTPKKVISFQDSKERAWQWKTAIESFQAH